LDSENIFTVELRNILTYKEELVTDMKNMLNDLLEPLLGVDRVVAEAF
jgi:hypothetical protein